MVKPRSVIGFSLMLALGTAAPAAWADTQTEGTTSMEHTASGEFEVELTPIETGAPGMGAMTIAKTFHGDLDATSTGQMLAVRTPVDGSAGYVAMEMVDGTLSGRSGTFALQHSGTMDRGAQSLSVAVVPDSGTGELTGLTGTMAITIEGGKHFYSFTYTLPE